MEDQVAKELICSNGVDGVNVFLGSWLGCQTGVPT